MTTDAPSRDAEQKPNTAKPEENLNQQLWKEMATTATRDQSEDPTKRLQQTMHTLSEALKANWYALDQDKNKFATLPEIEFFERHKAPDSQTKQAMSFFRENGGIISNYVNDKSPNGASQAQLGISEADRRIFDIITDSDKTRIRSAAQEMAGSHFWGDSLGSTAIGAGLGAGVPFLSRRLAAAGFVAETGTIGTALTSLGSRSPYLTAAIGAAALAVVGTYAAYKWHQGSYEGDLRRKQTDLFKLTMPTDR